MSTEIKNNLGAAIAGSTLDSVASVPAAKVVIKQIASGAGRTKSQIATLNGLALNKIGRVSVLEDTKAVQGMIAKVKHLVSVLGTKL